MAATTQTAPGSTKLLWAGRILSALPILMLLMSAAMKLMNAEAVKKGFQDLGWPEHLAVSLGIVELACALLYAVPPTAVLGAILLTGYLGGAVATHVRIEEPFFAPILLGVLVWGGLSLREPRLRVLLPLRR